MFLGIQRVNDAQDLASPSHAREQTGPAAKISRAL